MFFFYYKNKCSKYEVGKVAIWQQFLISGIPFFNICVLFFSSKKYRAGQKFFNALYKRVASSLQKRKHHNTFVFYLPRTLAKYFILLFPRSPHTYVIRMILQTKEYLSIKKKICLWWNNTYLLWRHRKYDNW